MRCETCAAVENPNLGLWAWKQYKGKGAWGWFFNYYTLRVGKFEYFRRENKLDRLFNFISSKLERYV